MSNKTFLDFFLPVAALVLCSITFYLLGKIRKNGKDATAGSVHGNL